MFYMLGVTRIQFICHYICVILNITLDACQSFNQVISSFYTLISLYDRHCHICLGQYIWDASNTYMPRSIYKICIEYMPMLVYTLCIEFICLGQLVQSCKQFLVQKLIMITLGLRKFQVNMARCIVVKPGEFFQARNTAYKLKHVG